MTQVSYTISRKRPADGPLPPASPSKHPRVTPYSKPRTLLSYVASVFSPASALPMFNKQNATPPLQNITPVGLASTRAVSKISTLRAPTEPSEQTTPIYPESRDYSQPTPETESERNSPSTSFDALSLASSKDFPSDRATANSSSPKRPPRRRSFHGPSLTEAATWGMFEPSKPSILNARNWKQLPSSHSTSSASSVASTSKVTLDSVSSWRRSADSTADRPSSSTSATSTGSYSETPRPDKPDPRMPLSDASQPGQTLEPSPEVFNSGDINSVLSQPSVTQPNGTFKYTPKQDIHSQAWRYRPDFSREKSSKKARTRPHIHHDRHMRDVKLRHKALWQSMKKYTPEWFARAKRRGYEGSEEEFNALADYTMRTMEAVHGAMKTDAEVKQGMDNHFAKLQPALFSSAKKVLEGPKPQTIFTPGFDLLSKVIRAKDAAIDTRLRPPRPPLPTSLPPEDEEFVDDILSGHDQIFKLGREQVKDADIARLRPCQWLNDEIINFYGAMINQRSESRKGDVASGEILNAFFFSTFFWAKFTSDGYVKGKMDRWTKKAKVDLFTKDIVIIPINHNQTHWTAAAINFRKKRFESYDSMGIAKRQVTDVLRTYVDAEHRNKKGKPFDFTGWTDYWPDDIPQQNNGFDCGVFTCQFMESLSRGEDDFIFTQQDMRYIRRRMIWEIAHVKFRSD